MISLGQKLYETYAQLCATIQNAEVDSWNTLEQSERDTWEALAASLP